MLAYSSLHLSFLFTFLCIYLSVPWVLLLFYTYIPRFSLFGWLCSFYRYITFLLGTLALLSLLFFLHTWNGTIFDNIRTAPLSQCIWQSCHTNVLLFLHNIIRFCFIFIVIWHCLVLLTTKLLSVCFGSSTFFFLCPSPIDGSFCSWLFDTLLVTSSYSCCFALVWICVISTATPFLNMLHPVVFSTFFYLIFAIFHIICSVYDIFLPF